MIRELLVLMSVALVAVGMADEKRFVSRELDQDGIRVRIGGEDGHSVTVDGAAFSAASRLFVVSPKWDKRYYGFLGDKAWVREAEPVSSVAGAKGLRMSLGGPDYNTIQGTQTLEILPGKKLRVATDIRMTSSIPGVVEHRVATIAEPWITGTKWRGVLKDGTTTSGEAWRWAPGTLPGNSMVLADFREVTFESPQGPFTISIKGNARLSLVDYRRNDWAEGERFYWFGVLGSDIPAGAGLTYDVIFDFPETDSVRGKIASVSMPTTLLTSQTVSVAPPAVDRIVPTPKQVKWLDGVMPLPGEISVLTVATTDVKSTSTGAENIGPALLEDAVEIYSGFRERLSRFGLTLTSPKSTGNPISVRFGNQVPGENLWEQSEAYALRVTDKEVVIDVQTTQGLLNALRTFEQLVRVDETGKPGIRRCEIQDYPSLPFRGIHFFTGKDARELQLKMVTDILAPLKINKLIYQVDYVKWESQPQIHSELLSMDKADARAVGDTATSQGIEVIPLVNTFGHSEWLLQRPEMRYLADDPNDPYAYDPSNPEVYKICEGIYHEAIEMFRPSIMHIGHDEVHLDGFPKKPANKAVGATQLFINDTIHYRDFLKNLGIRTMIWGDMLLGPGEAPDAALAETVGEARRRRGLLPKDIIITDWHYKAAPVADYQSIGIFNDEGFDAIACTWSAPDNIVRFAKAAAEQRENTTKSLGLIQTTWAGYSFDENSLVNSLDQYMAYVLAAEAAWTGGAADSDDVPFDYQEEFMRRWNGGAAGGPGKKGWIAQLPTQQSVLVPADLSLAENALDGLKPGLQQLGEYKFQLPNAGGKVAAVRLSGAWDATEQETMQTADNDTVSSNLSSITFVLNSGSKGASSSANENGAPANAAEVNLALATPFAVPDGTAVGKVIITLEGQQQHSVDLRYGKNILSIADGRHTLLAPIVWRSKDVTVGEGGAVIHITKWENPLPQMRIKSIELQSAVTGPGVLLFGVSGVE